MAHHTIIDNIVNTTSIPTSIAPWLPLSDGEKAVAFYKSAFGAVEEYRLEIPGGGLVAQLSVNGAVFWLSAEPPSGEPTLPESTPANCARMILTVADPDGLFIQAIQAGATEIFPVSEEHGWRLGRVADPFGYHWEIGRPLQM